MIKIISAEKCFNKDTELKNWDIKIIFWSCTFSCLTRIRFNWLFRQSYEEKKKKINPIFLWWWHSRKFKNGILFPFSSMIDVKMETLKLLKILCHRDIVPKQIVVHNDKNYYYKCSWFYLESKHGLQNLVFSIRLWVNNCANKNCQWLDLNCGQSYKASSNTIFDHR